MPVAPRSTGCTTDSNCGGSFSFDPGGDKLSASDNASDNYGVYVQYYRADQDIYGEFRVTGGAGDVVTKNMDIKEGAEIQEYVCLLDHDNGTSSCSDWVSDIA